MKLSRASLTLGLLLVSVFGVLHLRCTDFVPPEPVEIVIWHTELDPDAERVLLSSAKQVEQEYADAVEGLIPVVSVSGLAWGDVATRLFQQRDNPPDITHLEPFMVYQVLREYSDPAGYSLHPLDNLIDKLKRENGSIENAVESLHRYQVAPEQTEATFGLAYAVGTTFIAYREDWNTANNGQPRTWPQLIRFADELAKAGTEITGRDVPAFILPGKSPFFIDQLTNEILVSLGGSLYRSGRPNFNTDELKETLYIFQSMIARTGGRYWTTTYREQFDLLAEDEGAVVPVTYGRATKQIDSVLEEKATTEDEVQRLRADFRVMPQPGPNPDVPGVATIDAEPWVIIARPEGTPQRELRLKIAERFLELFYERARYLKFCSQVPVHLRPVFTELSKQYDEQPSQRAWGHWVEVGKRMLARRGGTAPILMDAEMGESRLVNFALSLQRNSVISDMVLEAYEPVEGLLGNPSVEDTSDVKTRRYEAIESAIRRAMIRAQELYDAAS